ncbi:13309_t:CDS:2, partial [Gigaspora rosea]
MKCGIFSNERFENTLKAILAEKVETNNANGLALLQYWEFVAIDQKEISKVAYRLYSIKVNSVLCERLFFRMGWFQNLKRSRLKVKERLDNAEKVRQAVTINRITSPTNKSNTESSSANNSNVESSSTNKSNVESRPVDKLNSELDGPNTPGHSKIMCDNISFDTTDLYNNHPAVHEDSKIELQYLFARDLSQPSFVRILQQCVEDNSVVSNTR